MTNVTTVKSLPARPDAAAGAPDETASALTKRPTLLRNGQACYKCNMRRWMRDRGKRRKQPAEKQGQENPAPLQPKFPDPDARRRRSRAAESADQPHEPEAQPESNEPQPAADRARCRGTVAAADPPRPFAPPRTAWSRQSSANARSGRSSDAPSRRSNGRSRRGCGNGRTGRGRRAAQAHAPRPPSNPRSRKARWCCPSDCRARARVRGSSATTFCRCRATWSAFCCSTTSPSSAIRTWSSPRCAPCCGRVYWRGGRGITWMRPTFRRTNAGVGSSWRTISAMRRTPFSSMCRPKSASSATIAASATFPKTSCSAWPASCVRRSSKKGSRKSRSSG